ncbi:hypothetical protein FRB93_008884 [Tulasnella sp. JGI-2019a]|nr:hypothetical protein FRB93_008884 [Tulasnella sp. JGI-2019a]
MDLRRRKLETPTLLVEESIQTDDDSEAMRLRSKLAKRARRSKSTISEQLVTVQRNLIASRRFIFPLGLVLGVFLAYFLFPPLPPHLQLLLEEYDMSIPGFSMPFDLEWRHVTDSLMEGAKQWTTNRDFKVGWELKAKGLEANYPVILIPGIVSTGLESWSTSPAYKNYFRKRLWGTTTMIRAVVTEKEKWMAALMLDPETGLDPPGIKVRAAQGLDAASTFIPGYWIWAKVIENLACLNYDTNNLDLAAYDWRLAYSNLEVRDGYFSRLKYTVESFNKRQGKKVVLVGHSMGSTVVLYFLKWVEAESGGNGGRDWVDKHIEAWINIGGPLLGVPKAMTAFLSGEMKDTVEVNPAGSYVIEKFFSRKDRAKLFRSWAGRNLNVLIWLLQGGDAVWGNITHAPDDMEGSVETHGRFFSFRAPTPLSAPTSIPVGARDGSNTGLPSASSSPDVHPRHNEESNRREDEQKNSDHQSFVGATEGDPPIQPPLPRVQTSPGVGNLTADESTIWTLQHTPNSWQKMIHTNYSIGIERDEDQLKSNNEDHRKWTNPLEIQLPNAPNMKIFCLYGHGKETERSYWYARGEYEQDEIMADSVEPVCLNTTECDIKSQTLRVPFDLPLSRQTWIDALVTQETFTPKTKNGVKIGEGDGTVPTISLGAMCVDGWKRERYNPAGIRTVTYEMEHRPESMDIRGGATTADHIDILGSQVLNEIVLKVAAGASEDVEDHFVSDVREYASKIAWD